MKRGFLKTAQGKQSVARHAPTVSATPLEAPGAVRLPVGKVNTTMPEGYRPGKPFTPHEFDGRTIDYPDIDAYCYTTLPTQYSGVTLADFPDNWTECLFRRGATKRAIVSTPGFLSVVPKPPVNRHRIGPSLRGIGMFATCDLHTNDLIFSERPLLVSPNNYRTSAEFLASKLPTPAQLGLAMLIEQEQLLQTCVDRMIPENRAAFFALHDCHTEDGSGPIVGRVRTNGIGIELEETSGRKDDYLTTAVFNVFSRINHSCTPNTSYNFDVASFSCQLRAIRDIKESDEIFINYCPISIPTAERQAKLKPYRFECTCPACSDPTSDALLARIRQSAARLPEIYPQSMDRAFHEAVLQESLECMAKIEAAGWQGLSDYGNHIAAVMASSAGLGRWEDKWKYEAMCAAWCEATTGVSIETLLGPDN